MAAHTAASGSTSESETAEAKKRPGRVKYGDITLKRGSTETTGGAEAKTKAEGSAPISHDLRTNVVARAAPAGASAASTGGVPVAAGDLDGDGQAEAAQRKSGSLVYLNRNRQKGLLTPPDRGAGSLSLDVPAGMCRAGAR